MFDKRINIFTGHFGSGKTEVAVNFAIKLSSLYNKTAIVDFDIVNPYFRTADAKDTLKSKGIHVITPMYANTNVDVPALPAEINSLFEKKDLRVVFDVGGDDIGARVLSRYREEILADDYEMFFVINTRRPMTNTPEKIEEMIYSIEASSRLKVTKLVNNTNLLQSTSYEDVLEGHNLIEQVGRKLNISFGFISGFYEYIHPIEAKINEKILYINKLIRLPWDC